MATGPPTNSSSSSKKLYSQKLHNNPQNPSRVPKPKPTPPQHSHLDTVASDDSSSSHGGLPYNGMKNSLPGYVKFDDKVRISLNCGSKSDVKQLKRKLVSELDQIRSLKKRLEAKEFSNNTRVGTLARVNSEVSYVGPTKVSLGDNTKSSNAAYHQNSDRDKKNSKANHKKEKILNSETGKKALKPSGGAKKAGVGKVIGRFNGDVFNKCEDLLEKLMKHQYGWVFNKPVDVKKLKLHDYFKIIKHPMDLGTVKTRLKANWYKSPEEFAEDVRLTFSNAMKYNEKGQDAHIMAGVLLKLFEETWVGIEAERFNASSPMPTSKRASAPPPAPVRTSTPPGPRRQIALGTESLMDHSTANISKHEGQTSMSKNPNANDPKSREMTFEEKQRLSRDLLNLPPNKLDIAVQIMRKRNPGLCQQGDEIEVDIDSFDSETLWELDRLVTNYKNEQNENKGKADPLVQTRAEADHSIQETNLTASAGVAPEESGAAEKFAVTSPIQREKQGDNVSRSSNSNSSSSDSGSSSSESGSGESSSGYGSEAGQ